MMRYQPDMPIFLEWPNNVLTIVPHVILLQIIVLHARQKFLMVMIVWMSANLGRCPKIVFVRAVSNPASHVQISRITAQAALQG